MTSSSRKTTIHRRDEQLSECKECACIVNCSSDQACIFNNNNNNCNSKRECSSSVLCADQLKVTAAEYSAEDNSKTALIAGLTTGLVVTALIVVTIAGFVLYKRRQCNKNNNNNDFYNKQNKIETPLQIPTYSQHQQQLQLQHYDYDKCHDDEQYPDSPFVIGAHSLQIPHLPDPPPALPKHHWWTNNSNLDNINNESRRSLNIPSNPSISSFPNYHPHHHHHMSKMTRSSSLKLTKYDYYNYPHCYYYNSNDSSHNNLLLCSPSTAHLPFSNNNITSKFDFYFCPPQLSQTSLQTNSTVGDGEITVYWDPGPLRPLN